MTLFDAATLREWQSAQRRYRNAGHGERRSRYRALRRLAMEMLESEMNHSEAA